MANYFVGSQFLGLKIVGLVNEFSSSPFYYVYPQGQASVNLSYTVPSTATMAALTTYLIIYIVGSNPGTESGSYSFNIKINGLFVLERNFSQGQTNYSSPSMTKICSKIFMRAGDSINVYFYGASSNTSTVRIGVLLNGYLFRGA